MNTRIKWIEMSVTEKHTVTILKTFGVLSPYLAVTLGLFLFKNGLLAVLLYHLILLVCIIGINRGKALTLLRTGFQPGLGALIALGGLLPGAMIYFFWPYAKQSGVNIEHIMASVHLSNASFAFFVVYSCFVNPILEESFWRGCFPGQSQLPGWVDGLFAGYHAVILIPVVRPVFVLLSFPALSGVSWIFRMLYRRTGGLAIPLVSHLVADIAILWAVWKMIH
jgi:membrane protease YdiL (CAAX protease family)